MIFTSTSEDMPRPAIPVALREILPPLIFTVESHFMHVAYEGSPKVAILLPVASMMTLPFETSNKPLLFIPFDAVPDTVTETSAPSIIISEADLMPLTSSFSAITTTFPP